MAGLLKKKKSREPEIPTSSMADIAFLLLIFFLVTTTINVDTGIGMTLPPELDPTVEPPPVKERNLLTVLVDEQGRVLLEDQMSSVSAIREEVKKHVLNEGADPAYAESADMAVVSIKTARKTQYESYIDVLNEAWMAYYEIWDAEARKLGYPNYKAYQETLESSRDDVIRQRIKAKISLAEPDEGE
ncbi:MAG: biopolymer transporter ExbD [Rhodothermales bacterium]